MSLIFGSSGKTIVSRRGPAGDVRFPRRAFNFDPLNRAREILRERAPGEWESSVKRQDANAVADVKFDFQVPGRDCDAFMVTAPWKAFLAE
jgi:hypothetical protein